MAVQFLFLFNTLNIKNNSLHEVQDFSLQAYCKLPPLWSVSGLECNLPDVRRAPSILDYTKYRLQQHSTKNEMYCTIYIACLSPTQIINNIQKLNYTTVLYIWYNIICQSILETRYIRICKWIISYIFQIIF